MNKLTPEIIESATDEQLKDLVAVYCLGWMRDNLSVIDEILGDQVLDAWIFIPFSDGQKEWYMPYAEWQPYLDTEKGKAQAIDLAEKYGLSVNFGGKYVYSRRLDRVFPADKSWQIAVLKACLYSVMGDM